MREKNFKQVTYFIFELCPCVIGSPSIHYIWLQPGRLESGSSVKPVKPVKPRLQDTAGKMGDVFKGRNMEKLAISVFGKCRKFILFLRLYISALYAAERGAILQ